MMFIEVKYRKFLKFEMKRNLTLGASVTIPERDIY